ncbi:MAG: efflux RND transporter periplasmic adaptor subunit [Pseudomonadota bacterium]
MNDQSELISQLRIDRSEPESRSILAILGWVLLVAAVLAGAGFGGRYWWQEQQRLDVSVLRVSTVEIAAEQSRQSVLDASGYVVARRQATVSAEVTGKVTEVLVEEGMQVTEGQVLARLDAQTEAAQLELAEAQLLAGRSALQEIEVQLADAERTLRREREVRERGLNSEATLDQALASFEALEARLIARRSDVAVAESSVALRRQLLDELTIRAPFDGVVIAKAAQPGEMVSPISAGGGFTRTGICTIVDMGSLEIEVDVNEAYIQRVSAGQEALARLDSYPDWNIPAEVIAVVPTADRQKATVRVRVGFLQTDERILPDMGVTVRFLDEEVETPAAAAVVQAIEVPAAAVRREGGQSVVFVAVDEVADRRLIQVGEQRRDRIIITAGLREGEEIVADLRGLAIEDGQVLRISGS